METKNHINTQEGFQEALCKEKRFVPIAEDMSSVYEHVALLNGGGKLLKGIPTGFKGLDDKMFGLHKSELTVIGGRSNCGKTALLLGIARSAIRKGYKVGIFSPDMDRNHIIIKIIAADLGIPLWQMITGRLDKKNYMTLKRSQKKISSMKLSIDDTPRLDISEMRARAIELQEDHGLDLLAVDSAQLIQSSWILGEDPVKHMTEIARGLKLIAQELKIPVIITAPLIRHLHGEGRFPQGSDLCELERSADVVLLIYPMNLDTANFREMRGGMDISLGITKNQGKFGMIDLRFDSELTSFSEKNKK
jgi:replicative DNA helicase